MDTRNNDNHLRKYDEKSLEKLQSRTVFTEPAYLFVFKKTEKIVAAIYLVTNLISDTEPIKKQIRESSLGLMSDILTLKGLFATQTRSAVIGLVASVSKIISLLKIGSISDQISPMNHSVLQRELTLLVGALEGIHPQSFGGNSLVLPQDFFNVQMPVPSPIGHSAVNLFPASTSSQNPQTFPSKGQYKTSIGQKDSQPIQETKDNIKDNRRETMLKLLKLGKPMGIKDFAKEIKDCSEKTLQRELLAMVANGVLKKTGERRWSLYSLI